MDGDWRFRTQDRDGSAKLLVARLASRQWGRVSTGQLQALGVARAGIARWVQAGYLHCVVPRVYPVGHWARSPEADLASALLYAGPGAMLSHTTAAWWWGLIDQPPNATAVSTPRRGWSSSSTDARRTPRPRECRPTGRGTLALRRAGYTVNRYSWRQVTEQPTLVAEDVRATLSGA
jgi:hypothetical protein